MLGIFSVGVSFGLGSTDSVLTCLGLDGFLYQLLFWIFTPIVLICLVVVATLARLMRKRKLSFTALVDGALPAIMRLIFLLYPIIVNKAFEARKLSSKRKSMRPCRAGSG